MSKSSARNLRINPQNLRVQEEALSEDSQQSTQGNDVQFRDEISDNRNAYADAEKAYRELRQLRKEATAAAQEISTLMRVVHLERAEKTAALSELNDVKKKLSEAVHSLNSAMLRGANDQQTIVQLQQENIKLRKDIRDQLRRT